MNYNEYKEKLKKEFNNYKNKLKESLDKFKEKQNKKLEKFKENIKNKNNKSKRKIKGGIMTSDIINEILLYFKHADHDNNYENFFKNYFNLDLLNIHLENYLKQTDFDDIYNDIKSKGANSNDVFYDSIDNIAIFLFAIKDYIDTNKTNSKSNVYDAAILKLTTLKLNPKSFTSSIRTKRGLPVHEVFRESPEDGFLKGTSVKLSRGLPAESEEFPQPDIKALSALSAYGVSKKKPESSATNMTCYPYNIIKNLPKQDINKYVNLD